MKTHRLNQVVVSILLLVVLLLGFIPTQSAYATPGTWAYAHPMISSRAYHTATLLNNDEVLVVGGINNSGAYLASAELYNSTNDSWTLTKGSMEYPRSNHTATLLADGRVLVAGGFYSPSHNVVVYVAVAELYDPSTDSWTEAGSLHTGRIFNTATRLSNGQVLVVGGQDSQGNILASAELYDPATSTWTVTGSLNTGREFHTATLLSNGQVLVTGGSSTSNTNSALASAELYDPTTGKWTATASMAYFRIFHTATLLSNGLVLVAGGYGKKTTGTGNNTYLASAELYDSTAGTWSNTGPMNVARAYSTATLISYVGGSETVLVAGGEGSIGPILNSAELYDPSGSLWTPTASSMVDARFYHTATQLWNGQVLVTGGFGNSGMLSSTELYDPTPPTSAPIVPVTLSPDGNTNTQPSYVWDYSPGATSYHLIVQTSADSTVIDVVVGTSFCSAGICTYHPIGTLSNGSYQFEVSASNAKGTSAFSVWMNFTVLGNLTISGNTGVDGVTLTYFDISLKTAASNSSGNYSFEVSYNWSETVTPSKAGYTFYPVSRTYSNVQVDQTGQDYTPIAPIISGNAGVGGAKLSYLDITTKAVTADSSGNYFFMVPNGWSGTVTPTKICYTFSPVSQSFTNVTSNKTQNFIATGNSCYIYLPLLRR